MARTWFVLVRLVVAIFWGPFLSGQVSPPKAPDLKIELRSRTGSNRFRIGEAIPLEALVSSSTPNRYLSPCAIFRESCFGFPDCRYVNRWSLAITPKTGWKDLGEFRCRVVSGPILRMPNHDLTAKPENYSYTLTERFRFNQPGRYTVRLAMSVGLDDPSTSLERVENQHVKPHEASATGEIVLLIVDASTQRRSKDWPRTEAIPSLPQDSKQF